MQCIKHPFDRAADVCTHCGEAFCRACLVYPNGDGRDAFCIPCTIVRAGVRARGVTKPVKRRVVKSRRKELAEALRRTEHMPMRFIELEDIPDVDPAELVSAKGRATDRSIDWCA